MFIIDSALSSVDRRRRINSTREINVHSQQFFVFMFVRWLFRWIVTPAMFIVYRCKEFIMLISFASSCDFSGIHARRII